MKSEKSVHFESVAIYRGSYWKKNCSYLHNLKLEKKLSTPLNWSQKVPTRCYYFRALAPVTRKSWIIIDFNFNSRTKKHRENGIIPLFVSMTKRPKIGYQISEISDSLEVVVLKHDDIWSNLYLWWVASKTTHSIWFHLWDIFERIVSLSNPPNGGASIHHIWKGKRCWWHFIWKALKASS